MRGWIWVKIFNTTKRERGKRGKEAKKEYPLHHCVTGNLIEGEMEGEKEGRSKR